MRPSSQLHKIIGVAVLALGLMVSAPAVATHQSRAVGDFDAEDSRIIEEMVRAYILNHPEVILEAVQKLRIQQEKAAEQRGREAAVGVKPVDSEDHIIGNPAASVKLVEFADFECPFCKRFHRTLKRVMDKYEKDGRVAWVYRHYPIYSKGRKEAQAAECANELGGNNAFWAFADRLFEVTPSKDRLDLALLPQIADEIGLDRAKFEACLGGDARGGKYADHIEADFQDAVKSGGTGTPYTVVIAPNGKVFPINGAQPYVAVRSIIDLALKEE